MLSCRRFYVSRLRRSPLRSLRGLLQLYLAVPSCFRDCSVYDHEFVIALYIAYDHASQLERAEIVRGCANAIHQSQHGLAPVSYTHLTLPTILRV